MNRDLVLAILTVALGAAGTYLLLPHQHGSRKARHVHAVGAAIGGLSLLLFATLWSAPGPFLNGVFFYSCGLGAVACSVAMVTARNPIHSALWFAAVVLSTTGLFVLAGAQFLAVGTVIVYAGAIIVTFLFVIMLAQMEGRAAYDRAARSPALSTVVAFSLFLALASLLLHLNTNDSGPLRNSARLAQGGSLKTPLDRVVASASRPTAQLTFPDGKTEKPHVAGLGETLYTDYLLTVELVGSLLFVALIGALAIATPKAPVRPGDPSVAPAPTA